MQSKTYRKLALDAIELNVFRCIPEGDGFLCEARYEFSVFG